MLETIAAKPLVFVLLMFGILSSGAALDAKEVDVYLLAGQSNMQGNAKLADLPETWQTPISAAMFWNGSEFVPLEPGKTKISTRPGEFGPELGFARTLSSLSPDRRFYLIKFHRSGQPLHHGWNGNRWVGGDPTPGRHNFYPGESAADANIGKHYHEMLSTARAAITDLQSQGLNARLRAVVWMQGEQDSKHEISASAYAASIARLKRRVEDDLAVEPAPFILGQVLPFEPALERFTHRTAIRDQQRRVDMRSGADEATAGCWMVSTDGMPLQADTVHYDARGQAMLGQAFALAAIQARQHLAMHSASVDTVEAE